MATTPKPRLAAPAPKKEGRNPRAYRSPKKEAENSELPYTPPPKLSLVRPGKDASLEDKKAYLTNLYSVGGPEDVTTNHFWASTGTDASVFAFEIFHCAKDATETRLLNEHMGDKHGVPLPTPYGTLTYEEKLQLSQYNGDAWGFQHLRRPGETRFNNFCSYALLENRNFSDESIQKALPKLLLMSQYIGPENRAFVLPEPNQSLDQWRPTLFSLRRSNCFSAGNGDVETNQRSDFYAFRQLLTSTVGLSKEALASIHRLTLNAALGGYIGVNDSDGPDMTFNAVRSNFHFVKLKLTHQAACAIWRDYLDTVIKLHSATKPHYAEGDYACFNTDSFVEIITTGKLPPGIIDEMVQTAEKASLAKLHGQLVEAVRKDVAAHPDRPAPAGVTVTTF